MLPMPKKKISDSNHLKKRQTNSNLNYFKFKETTTILVLTATIVNNNFPKISN